MIHTLLRALALTVVVPIYLILGVLGFAITGLLMIPAALGELCRGVAHFAFTGRWGDGWGDVP